MPSDAYRVPGPVVVGVGASAVTVGTSRNGVEIRPTTDYIPVVSQDSGEAPASYIYGGKACIVECLGLEPAAIKAAESNLLQLLTGLANLGPVGSLASAVGVKLTLTESDAEAWIANTAVPFDPENLNLKSTQELQVPLRWLVVPDSADVLFATVPSYIA